MVQSLLDPSIYYKEQRTVLDEDKSSELSQYEIDIKGVQILGVIGNMNYEFIDKGIIYFPIYAVNTKLTKDKYLYIGVYEIEAISLNNYLDDDEDIDIDKMNDPLLFSFATISTLENYSYAESSSEEDDDDKDEDYDREKGTDESEEDDDDDDESNNIDELISGIQKIDIGKKNGDESEDDKSEDEESNGDEDKSMSSIKSQDDDKSEDEYIIPKETTIIKELFDSDTKPITKEELEEHIKDLKKKEFEKSKLYEKSSKKEKLWVQKLFKNNDYNIVDNEGGGDCLFLTIKEAFQSIGKDVTVKQLRELISNEATQEQFEQYKMMYDSFKSNIDEIKTEMKGLKQQNDQLKKQIKKTNKKSEKQVILQDSRKIVQKYKELKGDYDMYNNYLDEFAFMKDVNSLDDFKQVLQTCNFWGETWAISTLERLLNIKLILISRENYDQGDLDNIIQCGQLNDKILEDIGYFKPKYYILVDWNGVHFRNITYKDKRMLTFEEIPMVIKERIIRSCVANQAGPFGIIPKFQKLKEVMEEKDILEIEYSGSPSHEAEEKILKSISKSGDRKSKSTMKKKLSKSGDRKSKSTMKKKLTRTTSKHEDIELVDDLFNPDIVFQFFEKSSNKKPGHGTGEKITPDYEIIFAPLSVIDNWRIKLNNSYNRSFELDGKKWNSVDHFFIASQYEIGHPDIYNMLSLDSGSTISKYSHILKAFRPASKGKYNGEQIIPSNLKIDHEFNTIKAQETIYKATEAKFSQNEDLKEMLKLTYPAKLNYYVIGKKPIPSIVLMEIRKKLLNV